MSRYNEVYQCTWDSEDFKSLSKPEPNAQTLWLYLLTGKHKTPLPGIYNIGLGALEDFLKWSHKSLTKCFQELSQNDMVRVDLENNVIYLPNWHKWNKPQNPNVLKGWLNLLDNIPNCEYKYLYYQQLKSLIKPLSKSFNILLDKSFPTPVPVPVPVPKPVPNPIPKPEPETKPQRTLLENESEIKNIVTEFYKYQKSIFSNLIKVDDKKINEGIEVIDRLIRIDNFKIDKITEVLQFIVHDDFWSKQILSLNGLRKKSKNGNTKFVNALLKSKTNNKSDVMQFNLKEAEKFLERGKNEAQ